MPEIELQENTAYFWRYWKVERQWRGNDHNWLWKWWRATCVLCLWLKLKFLCVCLFRENMKVEAASKEAAGVLDSDSGVFKHNTLPHNCFQEAEQPGESDVYFIPKYTCRLWRICVWASFSVWVCATHCYKPYHCSQCHWLVFNQDFLLQFPFDFNAIMFIFSCRATSLMGGAHLLYWVGVQQADEL